MSYVLLEYRGAQARVHSLIELVPDYLKPVYRKPRIHNGYFCLRKFGL
jgi:hypothetical protein